VMFSDIFTLHSIVSFLTLGFLFTQHGSGVVSSRLVSFLVWSGIQISCTGR
jgi:hypothetical protein